MWLAVSAPRAHSSSELRNFCRLQIKKKGWKGPSGGGVRMKRASDGKVTLPTLCGTQLPSNFSIWTFMHGYVFSRTRTGWRKYRTVFVWCHPLSLCELVKACRIRFLGAGTCIFRVKCTQSKKSMIIAAGGSLRNKLQPYTFIWQFFFWGCFSESRSENLFRNIERKESAFINYTAIIDVLCSLCYVFTVLFI